MPRPTQRRSTVGSLLRRSTSQHFAMECGGFSHFAASPTGHLDMWVEVLRFTIGWAAFFYAVACAFAILERAGLALQPSSKTHENSVFVLAQGVGCTTKSLIVSLMGLLVGTVNLLLYYCTTLLLYYCIIVLLYYCIIVLLYYCIAVLLYYCITVLM